MEGVPTGLFRSTLDLSPLFLLKVISQSRPCFYYHECKKWDIDGKSKTVDAKEISKNRNNKIQANIEDLNPGTTYTVRLRVLRVAASEGGSATPGKPSPELIIDTEAVSCTPKASQCIIL